MNKRRLDQELVLRTLAPTRSQAENMVRMGDVRVNSHVITKPGYPVDDRSDIVVAQKERYVSRAGLKLASVAKALRVDFTGTHVLDVGSSTGGFTDYALKHGATRVTAVDVGTDQLHPSLRSDTRIDLHEQTDIRDFDSNGAIFDIIVIDVSFISITSILSSLVRLAHQSTTVVAMVKPQFEAGRDATNRGVVKNERHRRDIMAHVEAELKTYFVIEDKKDSDVAGVKGNRERFYRLKVVKTIDKT